MEMYYSSEPLTKMSVWAVVTWLAQAYIKVVIDVACFGLKRADYKEDYS